jgi:hypothetical protein
LSGIAARYGVPLDAVIRSNPQIANPNVIRPGDAVKIPETLARYDEILASLDELHRSVERDYRARIDELAAVSRDGDALGAEVDLAADLATSFVGMGKAMLRYGGTVRYAAVRKETFKAAEKVLVYAASQDLDQAGTIGLKAVGHAEADQYLRMHERVGPVDAGQFAAKAGKEAAKGATKAIAKSAIKSFVAADKQSATELIVTFAIHAAFTGLKKASDVLGAVNPSTVASVYMRMTSGEDLRTTIFRTRQHIDASHARTVKLLATHIDGVVAERNQAYRLAPAGQGRL